MTMDNQSQSADVHLGPLLRSRAERYLAEHSVREALLNNATEQELQQAREILRQKERAEQISNERFNASLHQMSPRFHAFRQSPLPERQLEYHAVCEFQLTGDPRDFPVRKEMLIGRH
ncbi:hypothetical protein [Amantichitinum ursilacus]|nr:hypothetical protein [Amantichitinum ursilacus]